jgi:hypothetical protein
VLRRRLGWLEAPQCRQGADDQEQRRRHRHHPIGVDHRRQAMGPAVAQSAQGDRQVQHHDRRHHARPARGHRVGSFDRPNGQPDRRERPAESITGSDRSSGEQRRTDRCQHETRDAGGEQPGRRTLERCDTEQQAQREPEDRSQTP